MLYDPKWETEVKPDVFSLDSLIAWLEKKPADKAYEYNCNGHCLLAQYFSRAGFENVHMFADGFWHGPEKCPTNVGEEKAAELGRLTALPRHFNDVALRGAKTFGAALSRARVAKAHSSTS